VAAGATEAVFFSEVCRQVLDPWFKARGFVRLEAYCAPSMVAYRRGRHFARFHFSPQDGPPHPVLAGLGEVSEGWGLFGPRKPMLHGLGLWEAVEDDADREVLRDTFGTRVQLVRLLERFRDRALPHAEPLFDNPAKMRHALRHRKRVPR
jgi:hypothetical protein